jgi:purine-binding chemotaxis protein CheW
MLVTRVGGIACALPIERVVETMRPLPIEPVRGALPSVRGMAVIRGAPLPVIDVAALLGQAPREQARFVVVRTGTRHVALLVDAVIEVRELAAVAELPPLVQGEVAAAVGAIDRELLVVLDAARLVTS